MVQCCTGTKIECSLTHNVVSLFRVIAIVDLAIKKKNFMLSFQTIIQIVINFVWPKDVLTMFMNAMIDWRA